jgi:hypothetical protein
MITFQEFLAESRSAPLYHATSVDIGIEICESNILKRSSISDPGVSKTTVSLTRNLPFAVKWADLRWNGGLIFQLDQQKLTQRYKIQPYSYFSNPGRVGDTTVITRTRSIPTHRSPIAKGTGNDYIFTNQFEETIDRDITNIRSYITKVYSSRSTHTSYIDYVFSTYNIPVEVIK